MRRHFVDRADNPAPGIRIALNQTNDAEMQPHRTPLSPLATAKRANGQSNLD